ncbi:uncharacterized protein LOC121188764, partial [Tachysurus ichikawai]
MTEIPSLLAAVRTLISGKITESSSNGDETEYEASVALPSPPQPTSPKPTSVPLGNEDSTRVSAHCWETAKAQPTEKGMARTLLLGLFSIDVLLKSNLTGGRSRSIHLQRDASLWTPRSLQLYSMQLFSNTQG